jgi:hypothetical protein
MSRVCFLSSLFPSCVSFLLYSFFLSLFVIYLISFLLVSLLRSLFLLAPFLFVSLISSLMYLSMHVSVYLSCPSVLSICLVSCVSMYLSNQSINLSICLSLSVCLSVCFPTIYLTTYPPMYIYMWSRVSSVSIVSDYGLDDRAIGVRSPAEAKDFSSSLCVQTGSGANPASCTMGTGVLSPGGKARPGRDTDHSPPSSAEVVNE